MPSVFDNSIVVHGSLEPCEAFLKLVTKAQLDAIEGELSCFGFNLFDLEGYRNIIGSDFYVPFELISVSSIGYNGDDFQIILEVRSVGGAIIKAFDELLKNHPGLSFVCFSRHRTSLTFINTDASRRFFPWVCGIETFDSDVIPFAFIEEAEAFVERRFSPPHHISFHGSSYYRSVDHGFVFFSFAESN